MHGILIFDTYLNDGEISMICFIGQEEERKREYYFIVTHLFFVYIFISFLILVWLLTITYIPEIYS